MRLHSNIRWWIGFLFFTLAQAAHAEDVTPPAKPAQPDTVVRVQDPAPSYPVLVVEDVKQVVGSAWPGHWDAQDWRTAGWGTLAVLGTAAVIDGPWRDEMRRHAPNKSTFMTQVERFGQQYAAGTIGVFAVAGLLGDETSMKVAEDAISASLIASGITAAIKYPVGRARPRDNRGVGYFQPFSNANASFPSGHTTESFALASVIANHYEETWVTCASYTVAGLVGVARTYHDAHFASDVIAGAMIGTLTGKAIVRYNEQRRSGKIALIPDFAPGMVGMRLAGTF